MAVVAKRVECSPCRCAKRVSAIAWKTGWMSPGEARDDAQHVCGGGLPLERLVRFIEQAHVLHGDHRLVANVRKSLRSASRSASGLGSG